MAKEIPTRTTFTDVAAFVSEHCSGKTLAQIEKLALANKLGASYPVAFYKDANAKWQRRDVNAGAVPQSDRRAFVRGVYDAVSTQDALTVARTLATATVPVVAVVSSFQDGRTFYDVQRAAAAALASGDI